MHHITNFLTCDILAYIDPNAGGWLFQLFFPVFVAIGGAWVVFRKKVASSCKRIFDRKKKGHDERK
jgi:hypothetical protein